MKSHSIFLIWTFLVLARPQDFFTFLQPLRPALLIFALTLVVSFMTNKMSPSQKIADYGQIKKFFLFYLIMIVGIPFAFHRGKAFDFVTGQYLNNVLYFYFFIVFIDSHEKLEKILYTACLSNFFYAALSLLNAGFGSGRFRYGTMYDPNDLAYFLISLFPLSFYFLLTKQTLTKKIIAGSAIALSLVIVLMTGSRGGIIGLGAVFLLIYFTKFSLLKMFQKVLLLLVIAVALAANIDKIDIERYASITNLEEDYNVTSEEGRMMVWQRGIELTLQNPIMGVGVDCFPNALGNYRQEIGVVPKWQTAHNCFILVLTELGIIGFLVFTWLIIKSLSIFYKCARKNSPSSDLQPITMMSKVTILAFVGHLTCAFFLSVSYSILFTLFFAISVTIENCCQDTA